MVSHLTVLDGVHFNYLTPMNEPTDAWEYDNGKQEGCHMSPRQQSRVVSALAAQLNISAPTVGIDAPEDYSEQDTINDFGSYSSGSLADVAPVTTHTYDANNPSGLKNEAARLGRPLWVSEYGDGDATGLIMAKRIHDDISGIGGARVGLLAGGGQRERLGFPLQPAGGACESRLYHALHHQ